MTFEDDAAKLAEITRELPAIDIDNTSAQRIAMRARQDIGKGRSRARWILPITATFVIASYAVWAVLKLIEVLR